MVSASSAIPISSFLASIWLAKSARVIVFTGCLPFLIEAYDAHGLNFTLSAFAG